MNKIQLSIRSLLLLIVGLFLLALLVRVEYLSQAVNVLSIKVGEENKKSVFLMKEVDALRVTPTATPTPTLKLKK